MRKDVFIKILCLFVIIVCFGYLLSFNRNDIVEKNEIIDDSNNNEISENLQDDYLENDDAIIHFLDTGNSDCIVIEYDGNYAIIDGADNNDEEYIVDYLNEIGVESLSFLQMTHSDADHCGGLDAVVANFVIDKVFVGNGSSKSKTYKDFIEALASKELYPSVPIEGSILYWDDNTYFQFYNTKTISNDVNDNSIITLFVNGNDTFLFTGDISKEIEEKYMDVLPAIDVLKVAHHGSRSSSSVEFIKKINPIYSVILTGENKYGHPHQETLNVLEASNVYTTDEYGVIKFISNGNGVSLLSTKKVISE